MSVLFPNSVMIISFSVHSSVLLCCINYCLAGRSGNCCLPLSGQKDKARQVEKSPRLGVLRLDLQPSPCAQAIIDISQSITYQFASHKPPLIIMEASELEITALRPGMVA